jgi:hypothetical protein
MPTIEVTMPPDESHGTGDAMPAPLLMTYRDAEATEDQATGGLEVRQGTQVLATYAPGSYASWRVVEASTAPTPPPDTPQEGG